MTPQRRGSPDFKWFFEIFSYMPHNVVGPRVDVVVIVFNSRTAIAGAIIGLLLVFFYFVVMIFVTTI